VQEETRREHRLICI